MAKTTIARGGIPARRGKPAVPPVAASRMTGAAPIMPPPNASGLSTPAFRKGGKVKKGKK